MNNHAAHPSSSSSGASGASGASGVVGACVAVLVGVVLFAGPASLLGGPLLIMLFAGGGNQEAGGVMAGCDAAPAIKVLSQDQSAAAAKIYRAVVDVAAGQDWPEPATTHAAVIALATVMQESSLGAGSSWATPNDDGDAGWYQQRTKPGWYGTVDQVTDPTQATQWFLLGRIIDQEAVAKAEQAGSTPAGPAGYTIPGLRDITGWQTMPVAEAAQAVQRSADGSRYAEHEPMARTLVAAFSGGAGCTGQTEQSTGSGMTCPSFPNGLLVQFRLTPDAIRTMRCTHQQFPQITTWFGVGDRPSNVDRDHQEGRALDALIPDWNTPAGQQLGDRVADWVVTNREALGVKYVIWRARIWSTTYPDKGWQACGQGGRCYTGPDDTLAHRDHIHISVKGTAGRDATPSGSIVLPIENYTLTGKFGQCGPQWKRCHTGLDFAAPAGTPILAIADGIVRFAGPGGNDAGSAYGQFTRIEHPHLGMSSWYAHQREIRVHAGDKVRAGQVIGLVGQTGNADGPHLHLEIHPGNGVAVNPYTYLTEHGLHP